MLELPDIATLLQKHSDPQAAADALVKAARNAGGYDNITVIVVNILNTEQRVERRQKRRVKWGIAVFLLVFALLVAATVGGVSFYAHNAAFLIEEDGYVSIYHGLPGDIAGVRLQWLEEKTEVKTSDLSPTFAQSIREGVGFPSIDDAREALGSAERLQ
jgi:protein phosphatase